MAKRRSVFRLESNVMRRWVGFLSLLGVLDCAVAGSVGRFEAASNKKQFVPCVQSERGARMQDQVIWSLRGEKKNFLRR